MRNNIFLKSLLTVLLATGMGASPTSCNEGKKAAPPKMAAVENEAGQLTCTLGNSQQFQEPHPTRCGSLFQICGPQ